MDELVDRVRKLENAQMGSLISRLELQNLRSEVDSIDVPQLRSAVINAQDAYDAQIDVLSNLLVLLKTARYRRSHLEVDRTVGKHLQDVMNARLEREGAYNRWWRGTQRIQHLRSMISKSEEELTGYEAVEQKAREECYAPVVELARVWSSCMIGFSRK